jgi:exodeoxyribonuclease VII small subunit
MTKPAPSASTFEHALAELEQLVAGMESGQMPLEDALAAYQRGSELVRYCQSKLADAEQRILQLEGNLLTEYTPPDA